MIDTFALLLSHGLVLLSCLRLLWRDDLDHKPLAAPGERRDGDDA